MKGIDLRLIRRAFARFDGLGDVIKKTCEILGDQFVGRVMRSEVLQL